MAYQRHILSVVISVLNSSSRLKSPISLYQLRRTVSWLVLGRGLCFWLLCLLSISFSFAAEQTVNKPLDINKASAQQIQTQLPGIGKVKAQAIVDYRQRNGPFATPEQLLNIKGVGPHTLDRIRVLLSFGAQHDRTGFFSKIGQQNYSKRDQAIRQRIKGIVTRAKQAEAE